MNSSIIFATGGTIGWIRIMGIWLGGALEALGVILWLWEIIIHVVIGIC